MESPLDQKTKQDYQMELGVNCIGPQLLQTLLDPLFIKTAERIHQTYQELFGLVQLLICFTNWRNVFARPRVQIYRCRVEDKVRSK